MHSDLTDAIERELLSWPGVSKEFRLSPIGDATIYWFGKRQLGHIHTDGVADLQFPKAVHDQLIAEGRAFPHRGGFPAVISFAVRRPEDVPAAVALFRLNYDRLLASQRNRSRGRGSDPAASAA